MKKEEFWNELFSSEEHSDYFAGSPSVEVTGIARTLKPGSQILDLGCGKGRSSLFLAEQGHFITAIDFSKTAIETLNTEARKRGVDIRTRLEDLSDLHLDQNYDMIIAHGSLHLLARPCWMRLINEIKEFTNKGGYNIIVVFTDKIPPSKDMEEVTGDLFKEGELFEFYKDWEVVLQKAYVKEDEHPGNIKHRHPINKLVAKK